MYNIRLYYVNIVLYLFNYNFCFKDKTVLAANTIGNKINKIYYELDLYKITTRYYRLLYIILFIILIL